MKTKALEIQNKLIDDKPLTYQDRTFLIGFITFSLEFVNYVREDRGLEKW